MDWITAGEMSKSKSISPGVIVSLVASCVRTTIGHHRAGALVIG